MRLYSLSALLCALLLFGGCALPLSARAPAWPIPDAPRFDVPDLEARVLSEVNRIRRAEGRPPLRPDTYLAAIARTHSLDMRDRRFIAHHNPDGDTPGERAAHADYRFRYLGENLFRGRLYDTRSRSRQGDVTHVAYHWHTPHSFAALVAEMWLESPSHRENLLAEHYEHGGVGIALGPEGEVLVTLNLSAL